MSLGNLGSGASLRNCFWMSFCSLNVMGGLLIGSLENGCLWGNRICDDLVILLFGPAGNNSFRVFRPRSVGRLGWCPALPPSRLILVSSRRFMPDFTCWLILSVLVLLPVTTSIPSLCWSADWLERSLPQMLVPGCFVWHSGWIPKLCRHP